MDSYHPIACDLHDYLEIACMHGYRLQVELGTERPGFLGSAIIASKATDVIDAGFYLTRAFKDPTIGQLLGQQ